MACRRTGGFTLVELVMVIVLIGVLAVFALPRMLDLTAWRLRAFADALQAETAAMQRRALAQRRPVTATITDSGVSFADAGGTLASLACPAAASPCITEPGPRSVTFNAANTGRTSTSTGSALVLTIGSGSAQRRLQIEAQTGLVRPVP
jgi:prepilin-type N-terminal cleavage/methylation domain-containing protein